MRGLSAAVAALALCLLPAAALGYGTSTTYVTAAGGTPPGAWAGLAAAQSAADGGAAATLTETDAGGVAPTLQPSNRTFSGNANGWSAVDSGAALCSISSGYAGAQGNPAGSIRTSYGTLLNLLNLLASCSATWTSAPFTWSDGAPAAVGFSIDRMVDLNGLVGVAMASWTVRLVDETVPGSVVLVSGSRTSDQGWTTQTATLAPGAVVSGRTYRIRIEVSFSSTLSLVSGFGVNFDNVTLSVTPRNHRATGEMEVAGVPPGDTHTLELRARTSGEPFELQVWNGAGWTTRATVSSTAPSWADVAHGLTGAEWNGGTVRVRLADTLTGVDATADILSVDYLRVVATGGITVSGPTSVTLPPVTLDGLEPKVSTGTLGPIDVVDSGGAASGWDLRATATRWALDGDPAELLPPGAFSATPAAPVAPDGDDLTGVTAGAGGTLHPSLPITLMSAAPGRGVGTYRQSPSAALTVPITALQGVYRSEITLSAS